MTINELVEYCKANNISLDTHIAIDSAPPFTPKGFNLFKNCYQSPNGDIFRNTFRTEGHSDKELLESCIAGTLSKEKFKTETWTDFEAARDFGDYEFIVLTTRNPKHIVTKAEDALAFSKEKKK